MALIFLLAGKIVGEFQNSDYVYKLKILLNYAVITYF